MVSTAIPSTDTILFSDSTHDYIQEIPDRKFLFNVQTPQAFKKSILEQAYQSALTDPDFHPTDDCGVIQKYLPEIKIKIVAGNPANLKITYPEDLGIAEKLLITTSTIIIFANHPMKNIIFILQFSDNHPK